MNSSLWYFPLSAIINAVTSTVLGFYFLLTSFRKRVARHLFFFCAAVAVWSYGYFLWQLADTADSALFWSKALMFGAIFTSISYLHLVLVFLQLDKEKFYKVVLAIFYFFSFIWVIANFSNYFVAGVEPQSYFKFWPMPGPFYTPYLAAFFFHVLYASVLLFKNYRIKKGSEKIQTALLLIGIFIAFFGGSTNYPLWYHLDIAPWGNALVSLYVILTVYAMMKYKFLDIKVVTAELFAGLFFIIFLVDVFLSKSLTEFIVRLFALIFTGIVGVMLIRSVRQEVKRREEIQKLAADLKVANEKLVELDQTKSDFLSIAAHQLRTPLSIVKGYISMIQEGDYGPCHNPKIDEILGNVYQSNEHLIHLVNDFLAISRLEAGKTEYNFQPVDLRVILEEVTKEIAPRLNEKGLRLETKIAENLPSVKADAEKIHHVIFNFLDNAIKYTAAGLIKVELFKVRANLPAGLSAARLPARQDKAGKAGSRSSLLVCQVTDAGLGFKAEDKPQLFQKFSRTSEAKQVSGAGVGLGLFVCRKFIEAHGGEIFAVSPGQGKGSTFGFRLPIKK